MMSEKSKVTSLAHLSNQQLWLAFKAGSIEAFETIYRDHVKLLFNYGMKVFNSEAVVEDCIQELFIDLWRRKAQLADVKKIDYYLMKALRWKIMRAYQQQSKRASETERYNTESLVTVSFPFETVLIEGQEASEKSLKIKEAIDSLSPKQKEVIHLLFFQKYSYEEVSDTMSMNIRSVYTLAWKAISTLRRYLLLFFTCTWMMSL